LKNVTREISTNAKDPALRISDDERDDERDWLTSFQIRRFSGQLWMQFETSWRE